MNSATNANPIMVSLARESRGWTQTDLAKAVGVSQAKISKYEVGTLDISKEDLAAIARALGFSESFFVQSDRVYDPNSSLMFYRKRVSVPVKAQRRIRAEINVRKMQVVRLLRGAAIDDENGFPRIPAEEFNGNVRRVANRVREIWKLPNGPISNLTQVVEDAGGIIVMVDFGTRLVDGTHLLVSGLPPIFFMNPSVPGERYRFSLAHEIAHAVMHPTVGADEEQEANEFAAEFLMPRRTISRDLRNLNLDAALRLKRVWKVSMAAIIRRARDVSQISESQYRRLFTRLSATGQKLNEPGPIPLEKPTLYDRLVEFHRTALRFSDHDMRELLFTDDLGAIERPDKPGPRFRIVGNDPSV